MIGRRGVWRDGPEECGGQKGVTVNITATRTFKTMSMVSLEGGNSFFLSLVSKFLNTKGDGVGFDNFTLIIGENATARHVCHSQHPSRVTRLEANFHAVRCYVEQTAMAM